MSAWLLALTAALAFAGVYRVSDHPVRQTLRFAGVIALWATCIVLITTWR
ncbi:hypothetical protein [Streptomyces kaniharaensis]|nr:hypothetical protein [Streptomyces kaniharaensis]